MELVLVVGAQHPPGPRVMLDDLEDGLSLGSHKVLVAQGCRGSATAWSNSTPRASRRFSLSVWPRSTWSRSTPVAQMRNRVPRLNFTR